MALRCRSEDIGLIFRAIMDRTRSSDSSGGTSPGICSRRTDDGLDIRRHFSGARRRINAGRFFWRAWRCSMCVAGEFYHQERLSREGWDAAAPVETLDVRNGPWRLRFAEGGGIVGKEMAPEPMELRGGIRADVSFALTLPPENPFGDFWRGGPVVQRGGANGGELLPDVFSVEGGGNAEARRRDADGERRVVDGPRN